MENIKYILIANILMSIIVVLILSFNLILNRTFKDILPNNGHPEIIKYLTIFVASLNIAFSLTLIFSGDKNTVSPYLLIANLIGVTIVSFSMHNYVKTNEEIIAIEYILKQIGKPNENPQKLPWMEAYYLEKNFCYKFFLKYISKDIHNFYLENWERLKNLK